MARLVLDPACGFAAVAEALAVLGWQRAQPARREPILAGEPELASFHLDAEEAIAVYTFNPAIRLRVLDLDGARADVLASSIASRLPVLDGKGVGALLSSDDAAVVLLGVLAAEIVGDPALDAQLAGLEHHPDRLVQKAARSSRAQRAARQVRRGTERLVDEQRRDPTRSALFRRQPEATTRRQWLRWVGRDRGAKREATLPLLRSGLEDPDWEVRVTAMLVAARLGARELLPAVHALELPPAGREGLPRDERDLLLGLRACVEEHLAGRPLPDAPDPNASPGPDAPAELRRRALWPRLRRLVAEGWAPDRSAGDRIELLVHALVEPVPDDILLPPPDHGLLLDGEGYRLPSSKLAVRWVPPLPHLLGVGDERLAPGAPVRVVTPTGFFVARATLTQDDASRLGRLRVTTDRASPWSGPRAQAADLCAVLAHVEALDLAMPDADAWECAIRGPDGRLRPWGNGLPGGWGRPASPWGAEVPPRPSGEWTSSTTDSGEAIACGLDREARCGVRTAVDPARALAVRFVVRLRPR